MTNNRIRVCHFCSTSVDTHYFRTLARGLGDYGISVSFATLGSAPAPSWLAETPGAGYVALGARSRRQYWAATLRLVSALRAKRVDILQTHLFDAGAVGILAGRLARVPLIVLMRHHLDQHQLLRRPIHTELDRLMARLADHVVVPGNAVRQHMATIERIDPSRIEVIHLAIDPDTFVPQAQAAARIRQRLGAQDAFLVGAVGRLDPGKGFEDLVAASKALPAEIDLRVVIVGDHPDPIRHTALEAEIARLGLAGKVELVGHQEEIAAWMRAMDVLVHPSLSEAFPQVVMEAMAVGTPVVATDVGGVPELVVPGSTGVLVAPRDPNGLAAAIMQLYRDPDLRRRYSEASAARIADHFSAAAMVAHYADRYHQWLGVGPDRLYAGHETPAQVRVQGEPYR